MLKCGGYVSDNRWFLKKLSKVRRYVSETIHLQVKAPDRDFSFPAYPATQYGKGACKIVLGTIVQGKKPSSWP